MTTRTLAHSQRILVAAPSYLDPRGRPATPADLRRHDALCYAGATGPWRLIDVPVTSRLRGDNDGVCDWCLAGHGVFMDCAIDVAVYLSARRMPRRVIAFLDALEEALR